MPNLAVVKPRQPAMVSLSSSLMDLIDLGRTNWSPPASIPEVTLGEVIEQHDRLKVLMQPAKSSNVSKWLASLGVLLAGRMSLDEAKVRIAAYAEMLDMPDYCYTKASLRAAALEFQWWPSLKELDGFLDGIQPEIARTFWRLGRLRALPTDEELAEGRAAQEAAKLAKMLSTPAGRIRHRHWDRFFRCLPAQADRLGNWYDLVESLLTMHPEEIVDAWHVEVAEMDWSAPDFKPLAELRARSRSRLDELDAMAPTPHTEGVG